MKGRDLCRDLSLTRPVMVKHQSIRKGEVLDGMATCLGSHVLLVETQVLDRS